MLRWIVGSSAAYRLLVAAFAAILLAVGAARVSESTVEALPNFGPVRVEVQTEALGLSPEEVENLITNPMEQEFFTGIPWLKEIRSKSAPGLSAVEMIFEPGANDVRARQVVQERLTMVPALPAVSKPPYVIQPSATTSRVLIFSMSSKTVSLVDLSTLARWKVRQRLLAVPGVSNVSIWGLRDRQLQVLIDPHKLRLSKVNVDDVVRAAANAMWSSPLTYVEASTPGTGGFIDTAHQRISINHTQPIKKAAELARITIQRDLPVPVRLGDVAEVTEGHQLLIGDAVLPGDRAGLLLVVQRTPDSSISRVTHEVELALDAMRPGLSGIDIDTSVFRATGYVGEARGGLAGSLGAGLVLAAVGIGVLFMNWRATAVSAIAVVLSLATGWLLLSQYGLKLDLTVTAGIVLALALVIDDAVVVVERIRNRLGQRTQAGVQPSAFDSIVGAATEVAAPLALTFGIVTLSVAPMLVLSGVSGDFVKPLALSYAVVALASLLVALIVTPALAVLLLDGHESGGRDAPLAGAYARALQGVLRKPVAVIAAAAVVVVAGIATLPRLAGIGLVPALQDRDIVVRMAAAPGTSLPAMRQIAGNAMREVAAIPGVRSVAAHIGRASTSDRVSSVDDADLWVGIAADADYRSTFAAIESKMRAQTQVTSRVSAYPNLKLAELTAVNADDLVVRVYGRDYDVLRAKAETVAKSIADIPGVVEPQLRLPVVEPTIEIEVNVDKASARGVKPGDVRRAAATMLSSITAGQLFEESKIFDVVVWGLAEKRDSVEDVRDTLVDAPDDSQVRVGDVADVRVRPNPSFIPHDAVSRYIDVTARVDGGLAAATSAARERLKSIQFPSEHHVEVLGEPIERQAMLRRLALYGVAAAIALYFVLQARVESWRLAALLYLALLVPLGAAALAAVAAGAQTSLLSLAGLLVVVALAARGSLSLVDRCRQLERDGLPISPELVTRAVLADFASAVTGTGAALLALLPVLFFGARAGLEVVMPMAAAVVAGLATALLTRLFVLPALYLRWAPPLPSERSAAAPAPELQPR